jgi:hypothetical protein
LVAWFAEECYQLSITYIDGYFDLSDDTLFKKLEILKLDGKFTTFNNLLEVVEVRYTYIR